MRYKGKVVVIAGPSGVGKNSIIHEMMRRYPQCSEISTATTRLPRPGEKHGVDQYFLTLKEFEKQVKDGTIPEFRIHPTTNVRYGTYLPDVITRLERGDLAMGDFDIAGTRFLKKHFGALAIFVLPPLFDVLEKRIQARHSGMSEDELRKRLDYAHHEIDVESLEYDYRIVNEEGKLNEAVDKVIEILKKEGYLEK